MRYFIEHNYNGTAYCGWQKQPNAITIQEKIESALSIVLKEPVEIVGSSRTDTGVHAVQQFAHFDIEKPIDDLQRAAHSVNSLLPFDLAVVEIVEVATTAHARFDATYRCYEYRIVRTKNVFLQSMAHTFRPALDIEAMNEVAKLLLQHTNFECFSKIHTNVKTFLCNIEYAYWEQKDDVLIFNIKANRFLRGMVRAIVGTLIEVGLNRLTKNEFEAIIISKSRKNAAAQAPACGLFLTGVGYDWNEIK